MTPTVRYVLRDISSVLLIVIADRGPSLAQCEFPCVGVILLTDRGGGDSQEFPSSWRDSLCMVCASFLNLARVHATVVHSDERCMAVKFDSF
jgi:hypothetical protein